MKINFDGGDLSSDAGLLLVKEFARRLGFDKILKSGFKMNDPAMFRIHKDDENLWQIVYQILGAYFEDDRADELTDDPVLMAILGKEALTSQPTLSRFFNRMDDSCTGVTDFLKSHCCSGVTAVLQHRIFISSVKQMVLPMSSA